MIGQDTQLESSLSRIKKRIFLCNHLNRGPAQFFRMRLDVFERAGAGFDFNIGWQDLCTFR
jgi:hypothetical protein